MKLGDNIGEILKQIERERGVGAQSVLDAIGTALASAYQKKFDISAPVEVDIDASQPNEAKMFIVKTVAEEDSEIENGISLKDAQEYKEDIQTGEQLRIELDVSFKQFGRLATQVAKQAILQRLREAERMAIYDDYKDKVGSIVMTAVQRLEKNNIIVKLNKSELVLPPSEQLPNDNYRVGDRLRLYLADIRETPRGHHIVVSRSHPGLVRCLFELEIPEISDGIVVIKSIAREAGFRTKISVTSLKGNVDPVGACIGSRGSRIQPIIEELRGEKIDIVRWSEDLSKFITNALSPAKIIDVKISEDQKDCVIIVPDDQLSLAIGRDGQNVRLAAHLTNCHLDIVTESKLRKKGTIESIQEKLKGASS